MRDIPVLVVEDDLCDQRLIRDILDGDGFSTCAVSGGDEALDFLQTEVPELILLDIMLPGINGFEVLRRIRQFSPVPVIALSALKSLENREKFLNLGGDDYITKPYELDELRFRVMAVLKRNRQNHLHTPQNRFDDGFLKIDFDSRRVDADRRVVTLPPREYNLLHEFVRHAGKTLTHQYLMTKVWGNEYSSDISLLHTCVARLRSKIEPNPTHPQYLITVSRVGYRFQASQS